MTSLKNRLVVAAAVLAAVLAAGIPASAADGNPYTVHPLVSDVPGAAPTPDPHLVNAWGLVAGPTTPWWVADNGTNLSTLYTGAGGIVPLVVGVDSAPTGIVFHDSTADPSNFVLPTSGAARFIFVTETGVIRGWNGGTTAQLGLKRSRAGAIYKGLAIADTARGPRLYAADFHNARVDVINGNWKVVDDSGFVDKTIPDGFAPFGIQAVGSRIFVTYAKQDAKAEDDVKGEGRGFVDVFDTSGKLLQRVARRGELNAPWGIAWAPDNFGRFGGDLLVGNFGNGQINAFAERPNGSFDRVGKLRDADGKALTIDGLWALQFGNGSAAGPTDTLFFTAGPDDESHGLFGSITPAG